MKTRKLKQQYFDSDSVQISSSSDGEGQVLGKSAVVAAVKGAVVFTAVAVRLLKETLCDRQNASESKQQN